MTRVMTTCHLTRRLTEQAGIALCDCTVLLILCIVEVSVPASPMQTESEAPSVTPADGRCLNVADGVAKPKSMHWAEDGIETVRIAIMTHGTRVDIETTKTQGQVVSAVCEDDVQAPSLSP